MSNLNEQELLCKKGYQAFAKVIRKINECHVGGSRVDELERDLFGALMEVGLACLEDFVEAAGDGDLGEQFTASNQKLKRSPAKRKRAYRSIFGVLEIERFTYSRGAKMKAIVKPLDQKLGLPEAETSYVLEDWITNLSVDIPYQNAVQWLAENLGISVSSTTAHRRIDKLGQYAEDFVEHRGPVSFADEQDILVAQADGKGVPIRTSFEQRTHEEFGTRMTSRAAPKTKHTISKYRKPTGKHSTPTQRATCGAFYSTDAYERTVPQLLAGGADDAPAPTNKRLCSELNYFGESEISRGSVRVFEMLAQERNHRDPEHRKPLACVMDGDPYLWALQEQYLPGGVQILDLYHVTEYLWKAGNCFHPKNGEESQAWVTHHLTMLLQNKVDCVRGLIKRRINKNDLSQSRQKTLQKVYNYLTNNSTRMKYGDYLAAGYPVGSGLIEGACKNIVGNRMCGAGMRWEFEGAQRMLDMRVTKLNKQWSKFIEFRIKAEHERIYEIAA